jgi:hypothetical protein
MAGGLLTLASGWFGTRMRCAKSSFSQELRARPREQSVHHDGSETHELRSIRRCHARRPPRLIAQERSFEDGSLQRMLHFVGTSARQLWHWRLLWGDAASGYSFSALRSLSVCRIWSVVLRGNFLCRPTGLHLHMSIYGQPEKETR